MHTGSLDQLVAAIAGFPCDVDRGTNEVFPVAVEQRIGFCVDGYTVIVGRSWFAS